MRRSVRAAAVGCLAVLGACSSPAAHQGSTSVQLPPLSAARPALAMASAEEGWAVWPSGDLWLLLHTDDGFRHVANRTPLGVPTDGGLVASAAGQQAVVAVEPVERLVRSPVLTATGPSAWEPAELPAGVVGSRAGVAFRGTQVTALVRGAGGRLLAQAGDGWRVVAAASQLPGASGLVLDGVTWADESVGWLTGHGRAGGAVAFRTTDGGATWAPVATHVPGAVAALAPCGSGTSWSLPVLDATGGVVVLRTEDGGADWQAGQRLARPAGEPAWGCAGPEVWLAAGAAGHDVVQASSDGGLTWTREGAAPADLTDLSPTGGGAGFAASGGRHPRLWAVAGDGRRFTPVALPSWTATLGGTSGSD